MSPDVYRAIRTHDFWMRQAGGGGGTPEPTIVDVSGASYEYRRDRNARTIVIRGGRSDSDVNVGRSVGKTECFMVFIEPDGTAVLQSLKQAPDCAMAAGATGRQLLEAAVKVAREGSATSLTLTDLSAKTTASGKKFPLSNMYFLTTGQTWYESSLPSLVPTTKTDKIPGWRGRVRTNTWADLLRGLGAQGVMFGDESRAIWEDLDIDAPGSAMIVLRRIKEDGTDFFADYDDELLIASGIGALYGVEWVTPL